MPVLEQGFFVWFFFGGSGGVLFVWFLFVWFLVGLWHSYFGAVFRKIVLYCLESYRLFYP